MQLLQLPWQLPPGMPWQGRAAPPQCILTPSRIFSWIWRIWGSLARTYVASRSNRPSTLAKACSHRK